MSEDRVHAAVRAATECMVSVLDVGCGPGKYLAALKDVVPVRAGIDAWAPDLEKLRERDPLALTYCGEARRVLHTLRSRSFDAVMLLDVLEHFTELAGRDLLRDAKRVAARRVIVFTPNGYVSNPITDGNPYQAHQSGWTRDDLRLPPLGFNVERWHDFDYGRPGTRGALWATWDR